jgi:DNA-binding response OmpR family regulator
VPDGSALSYARKLRADPRTAGAGIIMISARAAEHDKVAALECGADDYVTKPFSAEHLEARLRAVLRRAAPDAGTRIVEVGELIVDIDAHEARLAGAPLDLSGKEFELLAYLAERPGRMVTKRELLAAVWRMPYGGADKTIDVHLSWLRRKLGETAAAPRYIHTKRGVGVRLVDPSE